MLSSSQIHEIKIALSDKNKIKVLNRVLSSKKPDGSPKFKLPLMETAETLVSRIRYKQEGDTFKIMCYDPIVKETRVEAFIVGNKFHALSRVYPPQMEYLEAWLQLLYESETFLIKL